MPEIYKNKYAKKIQKGDRIGAFDRVELEVIAPVLGYKKGQTIAPHRLIAEDYLLQYKDKFKKLRDVKKGELNKDTIAQVVAKINSSDTPKTKK